MVMSFPAVSAMAGTGAQVLVEPEWLEAHLHDPSVRVIEVDVSAASHLEGHIEGAVLWNVYRDLKNPDYELIGPADFQRLLERSGVRRGSTVVFCGYAPALGLWLLSRYGHRDVRLLNCSLLTWAAEGRRLSSEPTQVAASRYELAGPDETTRADQGIVRRAIGDPAYLIVDVRSAAEFRGERFWPSGAEQPGGRTGHIPSAHHLPIDGLLDARGAFATDAELRAAFANLPLAADESIVTYCAIGGRAATAWFALSVLLGHPRVAVYDGSWAEWGRHPGTPVSRS